MKNKTEQRGFLWLSIVLLAVLLVLMFVPHKSKTIPIDEATSEAFESVELQDSVYRHERHRHYSYNRHKRYGNRYEPREGGQSEPMSPPDFTRNREERRAITVELNSADTLELQDLYGIGPYFAQAIVKYRNRLGGYVRKEQLLEVYGMNADRYQAIAQHITVDSASIQKININTADYATLKRHPYIDNYQARAIIKLRSSGVHFSTPKDLLKVSIIDIETVNKLTPYISFEDDTIHRGPDGPNA